MTNCPDCSFSLKGRTKCRCGWVMPASMRAGAAPAVKRFCSTIGCEQVAAVGKPICTGCDERARNERADAACRAKGLNTTEERRAYCRQLLKRGFGRPSFERWAEALKQATVDILVLQDSDDDRKTLARLRAFCAIDDENRVIPLEQRPALREARAARIHTERERVDSMLKAQGVLRREIDNEAQA